MRGLAIVTGQLGLAIGRSAVVAEWATGKVPRVGLTASGTSWAGTVALFLTGLKNPMPILLDAASALLVGDWGTGTVYRIVTG